MDGKTEALLAQINNKLNYLIAKERKSEDSSSESGGNVDFIVDMFDRADFGSLGEYWQNTGRMAIRSGKAINFGKPNEATAINSQASLIASKAISGSTQLSESWTLDQLNPFAGSISRPLHSILSNGIKISSADYYQKNLSSNISGVKIKIIFFIPKAVYISPVVNNRPLIAYCQPTLIDALIADSADELIWLDFYCNCGVFSDGEAYIVPSVSTSSNVIEALDVLSSVTANPGDNELLISHEAGGDYTISINDSLIFSGNSKQVINATKVGMVGRFVQILERKNYNGLVTNEVTVDNVGAVKSFKAWRSDMPEPPDESGHGTYDAESTVPYQYSDKYHQRQVENGQFIGYTYNPEA